MSIALKPSVTEPNGNISPIFNINNFYHANDYASNIFYHANDYEYINKYLLSYANLYNANFFQYLNTFASGLNFAQSINGISDIVFSYVAYLPNIISEIRNISYDETNDSTNIIGSSFFETSSINTNLNVGSSLNVDTILSQKMLSNIIQVNDLSCMRKSINGQIYCETVGFLYINGISLPLEKSNLLSNFNINSITSFYFTLKNGYRLDLVDANDNILFSYTNTTSDYIYFQEIPYNSNMIKINIYNSLNIIT